MSTNNAIMESKKLVRSNGLLWSPADITKTLKERIISKNYRSLIYKCILHDELGRAQVQWTECQTVEEITYEHWCRECSSNENISEDNQLRALEKWLSENELVDGKYRQHHNPFDYEGKLPELTFLIDTEGNPMLYRGNIHFIYGKPGTYKSWVVLSMLQHHDVRFWDFENGMSGVLRRLQSLGVDRERANYFDNPQSAEAVRKRVTEYVRTKPEVVCIDGFSGLAGVMEINPESNQEVQRVFNEVLVPLRNAGVTTVVLDHLPKDSSVDDYPIGAQTKKSQSDVAYLFKQNPANEGVVIYVSKDRNGAISDRAEAGSYPKRYGTVNLVAKDESISVQISPLYVARINGTDVVESEALMRKRIWDYIDDNESCSKSDIERNVPGKTERKRKALKNLVDDGYVLSKTVGTSMIHSIIKPLEIDWEPMGRR
jgi:hypothetical protein